MRDFFVDFFRDEVRCGFYVPTAIKQVWAAELKVLDEIDRICVKPVMPITAVRHH